MSKRILINDIINIANCLIVLNPATISYLELAWLDEFFYFLSHLRSDIIIPVLEKNNFSYEVFSCFRLAKSFVHRVKYGFGASLVHCIKKLCGTEVEIFKFIIVVEPECIEMGMKRYIEFFFVWSAFLW
jgi:hypothetical protein